MAGKLDVYNLGALGVNLVDGPIHMKDGELLQCQNAIASPIGAQVALVKRPGMDKINAVAAAGTILSINNIPMNSFGDTPTSQFQSSGSSPISSSSSHEKRCRSRPGRVFNLNFVKRWCAGCAQFQRMTEDQFLRAYDVWTCPSIGKCNAEPGRY